MVEHPNMRHRTEMLRGMWMEGWYKPFVIHAIKALSLNPTLPDLMHCMGLDSLLEGTYFQSLKMFLPPLFGELEDARRLKDHPSPLRIPFGKHEYLGTLSVLLRVVLVRAV